MIASRIPLRMTRPIPQGGRFRNPSAPWSPLPELWTRCVSWAHGYRTPSFHDRGQDPGPGRDARRLDRVLGPARRPGGTSHLGRRGNRRPGDPQRRGAAGDGPRLREPELRAAHRRRVGQRRGRRDRLRGQGSGRSPGRQGPDRAGRPRHRPDHRARAGPRRAGGLSAGEAALAAGRERDPSRPRPRPFGPRAAALPRRARHRRPPLRPSARVERRSLARPGGRRGGPTGGRGTPAPGAAG